MLTGIQRHIDKQRETHREKARTTDRQGGGVLRGMQTHRGKDGWRGWKEWVGAEGRKGKY